MMVISAGERLSTTTVSLVKEINSLQALAQGREILAKISAVTTDSKGTKADMSAKPIS